jgi:AMMECR1 domain-containing protein
VAIPAGAAGAVEQTAGLATSVASSAKAAAATASSAYQSVQYTIGPYTSQLKDAVGAALRIVEAANGLQLAAVQTGNAVARTPLAAVALSSSQTLGNKAAGYQQMASSASRLLRGSVGKLESLANVPQATIQSVRVAAACAERTATMCRQTTGEVAKITGVAAA